MWIPGILYERLPILYLLCAGICLMWLGLSVATATSALLLCAAAALAHWRRRSARSPLAATAPRRPARR